MADARACFSVTYGSSSRVALLATSNSQAAHARSEQFEGHKISLTTVLKLHGRRNVDHKERNWRRECGAPAAFPSSKVVCGFDKAWGTRCHDEKSAFARNLDSWTHVGGGSRSKGVSGLTPGAVVKEEQAGETSVKTTSIKEYLEDLKAVGRVRLIVNTGVAVLESVTSLETLFYHPGPRGEYANIMKREDNVDFHLLLEKVKSAKLVTGKSMKGDIPTYMVRFMDVNNASAVTILVMWKPGTDGEYDPGQVEGFETLKQKYGEEVNFLSL